MEALLATHLIEFGVHIRILIPLESAGIRTLGDLIKQSRRKLKKIKQLGDRSIHKLETLLEYHSLSFAED